MSSSDILTTFDIINFIGSLASLILSIIAIWLTLHFKKESDQVNTETRNLLVEIRTDAKSLTFVANTAMGELSEYGKASRELTKQIASAQISTMTVSNLATNTTPSPSGQATATQPEAAQEKARPTSS